MKHVGAMAAAGLLLCMPSVAAPNWIKLSSQNFEIYSTASEREARSTLAFFEQVREFFVRVKSDAVTTRLPVTIVSFRDAKEYAPYQPNETAAAYYIGDEQRDYIVMGASTGRDNMPIAIHEYMHLLVRHSGLKMPLWLDEGFAEVYSTLKPGAGETVLGAIPEARAITLSRTKWMPLAELVDVGHDSPEYNEKDRAGILYAQSWLLAHMLMLGNEYKDGFLKLVAALDQGTPVDDAFQAAFGKRLWEVELDLREYSKARSLNGVVYKTQIEKVQIAPGRPAESIEVNLTMAKLVTLLGRSEEAKQRFAELARLHPQNAEVEEALAYLSWREDGRDAALKHFARAIKLGRDEWKTYWDYARLLGPHEDEKAYSDALKRVLQLKPDMIEARLALGHELVRQRSWEDGLTTLKAIKRIDPARATELFLLMGYCSVGLDRLAAAKVYAADAKKHAKDPLRVKEADALSKFLERGERGEAQVAASTRKLGEDPAYQLTPWSAAKRTNMTGNFKRLDCLESAARMHVMDGRDTLLLLIRQPDTVRLRGLDKAEALKCGPRNDAVTVHFVPGKDERFHTVGEVREIVFIP